MPMFDEISKYKSTGHFLFKKDDNLRVASKNVPDKPGVYYVVRLAQGKLHLVYIGKSGTMNQCGEFKDQLLKGRINNIYDGMRREDYFKLKIEAENIDALDIYWFVTMDGDNNDLQGYVEGLLMQRYFERHQVLPPWNKCF
jgi:hypothetical protein